MSKWDVFLCDLESLRSAAPCCERGGAQHWAFWRRVILYWLAEALKDLPVECPFEEEEEEGQC